MCLLNYFVIIDGQQKIEHILTYKMNPNHKVVEHINYMYCCSFKLYIYGVHEFYIEQQMEIVLNFLLEECNLVRQSFKNKLNSLDFNTFAHKRLLEREHFYTAMDIRHTGHSARHLDPTAKFFPWFDIYELGGHENVDVDDIIGDLDYVPPQ